MERRLLLLEGLQQRDEHDVLHDIGEVSCMVGVSVVHSMDPVVG
jgi:hypothetical protein